MISQNEQVCVQYWDQAMDQLKEFKLKNGKKGPFLAEKYTNVYNPKTWKLRLNPLPYGGRNKIKVFFFK